jgi:hypothetical protein
MTTFVSGNFNFLVTSTSPQTVSVRSLVITSVTDANIPASVTNSAITYTVTDISINNFTESDVVTCFIPSTVTSITDDVFNDCVVMTTITVDSENINYSSLDGVLFNKDQTILISYPIGKTETSYIVPNTVKTISFGSFASAGLTSITFNDSLLIIEHDAFFNNIFTSITIPSTVTTIQSTAFSDCSTLVNVYFLGNIPTFSNNVFVGISENSTAYYLNNATNTDRLNQQAVGEYNFENVVQLKYISQSGGITSTTNAGQTSETLRWSPVPNVKRGTFTGSVIYTIKLSSSSVPSIVTNVNSFIFNNLQPNTPYNYTVSYSINPFLETVSGTFTTTGIVSGICFIGTTEIATDQGEIQIQHISSKRNTIGGKKIIALTQTTFSGKTLVKIERDALEKNVPSKDTIMTPEHQVMYKNKLVRVGDLYNMRVSGKIQKVKYDGEVMYNILMESHGIMVAQNMPVETLHPDNMVAKIYRDFNFNDMTLREKWAIIRKMNALFYKESNKIVSNLSSSSSSSSSSWKLI